MKGTLFFAKKGGLVFEFWQVWFTLFVEPSQINSALHFHLGDFQALFDLIQASLKERRQLFLLLGLR
jgi:hypothetical protein